MRFSEMWRSVLENTPGLYLWQDSVTELTFSEPDRVGETLDGTLSPDGGRIAVTGVKTALGATFTAKAVVLTTGTFLNGLMHVGRTMVEGGRSAEPASHGITEQLKSLGFKSERMKTGTPVRIDWTVLSNGN